MYKIEATIPPQHLLSVKESLSDQGFEEFTITDIHSHESPPGAVGCYRGATFELPGAPLLRIELSVPDEARDAVIHCIVTAAHTGAVGDGTIFVTRLVDVIEISLGKPHVSDHGPVPTYGSRPSLMPSGPGVG